MRRLALTLVWLALGCSGRDPTQATLSIDAAVVQTPAAQNIAGHIDGQIIGPSAACGGGLTEVGTGSLRFELAHTYTTGSGDTFTTTDRVVAAPTNPPAEYLINNQVDVTGGTGQFAGASGFLRTHGTVNLQTGVVSVDYHGRISTP